MFIEFLFELQSHHLRRFKLTGFMPWWNRHVADTQLDLFAITAVVVDGRAERIP